MNEAISINTSFGWIASGINVFLTASQVDEYFRYIQLALTILTTLITISYSLYNWYKKAKSDGIISKDEIKDGINIIKDSIPNNDNTNEKEDESNE